MPIPTSGQITWDMIRHEFGGPYPINISEYYRGGPRVPNTAANANVPTSGPISAASFYGASASIPLAISVSPEAMVRASNLQGQSVLEGTFTITASGGAGGYSYSTVWLSNPNNIGLFNANTSLPGVSSTGQPIQSKSGTLRITVTSGGQSVSVDRMVNLNWGMI